MNITIKNCNNIIDGTININENQLNIYFGSNGSGKSTISRAMKLKSENIPLEELSPYENNVETAKPSIIGLNNQSIEIFNDNYVKTYLFQKNSIIKNSFDVFIRTEQYDALKEAIDKDLENIKKSISNNKKINNLNTQIEELLKTIKTTSTNKIAKRGGTKGILKGKGAYFNPPQMLNSFKPFYSENTVSEWVAWKLKGYENFGDKGYCPYCSSKDSSKTEELNKIFEESFDKSSLETTIRIKKIIETSKPYLNELNANKIISLFGLKDSSIDFEEHLSKLRNESEYLHNKLSAILSFNGMTVDKNNIGQLQVHLNNMKIDKNAFKEYYTTEIIQKQISLINNEVDNLLEKVNLLKKEITQYHNYIKETVDTQKKDINKFLRIAGFNYELGVKIDGENNSNAYLKYILPTGKTGSVLTNGENLSWGEKHSFALILFMFNTIKNNTELIILDDPISSFDRNKKYAIINRLFRTKNKETSFYNRTVLMLTHDFEPIIDFIKTKSGGQHNKSVCASYFQNHKGIIKITPINKSKDMMSSTVLLKELSKDQSLDIAARIGCLRKFIEHQYLNPRQESNAYNVLSSLIHARKIPTKDNNGTEVMTEIELSQGEEFIHHYIPDFDYQELLKINTAQNLLNRYSSEKNIYIKMLIIRYYTEQNGDARKRLRTFNDVLRKYIDETYHIENDYLYCLDVRNFNIVPYTFVEDADNYVSDEKKFII